MFEKDIDIDYGVIIKNKVPILTMDSNWKTIFGNSNNKDINNYKNILNDLIKEQRELSRKLVQQYLVIQNDRHKAFFLSV